MARFDVYRLRDGARVVDCQSDYLGDIGTRFVIPLEPHGGVPSHPRINPSFDLSGERVVMLTQFASSVRTTDLGMRVGSLDHEHFRIVDAIDALIGAG